MARKYSWPAVRWWPAFSASSRLPDQLIGQRGPCPQEVTGAGVGSLGGGLPDRAAGPVDLVDQTAAVQCGDDAEIPHVVAGEELEHDAVLSLRDLASRADTAEERALHGCGDGAGSGPGAGRPHGWQVNPGDNGVADGADPFDGHLDHVPGFQRRGVQSAPPAPQLGQAPAVAAGSGAENVTGADLRAAGGVGDELLERPAHIGQQVVADLRCR